MWHSLNQFASSWADNGCNFPVHSLVLVLLTARWLWPLTSDWLVIDCCDWIYLATCSGCSLCRVCLSAARSHRAGGARPVSDSLIPVKKRHIKKEKLINPPHIQYRKWVVDTSPFLPGLSPDQPHVWRLYAQFFYPKDLPDAAAAREQQENGCWDSADAKDTNNHQKKGVIFPSVMHYFREEAGT